jgi:FSR family fosmidomycin resistance protein-like MFS transporter
LTDHHSESTAPHDASAVDVAAPSDPGTRGAESGSDAHTRRRFWFVTSTHALVDIFPMFFTSLIIVLRGDLSLTERQVTIIFMATPVFSGVLQPFFAWWGDRHDTRLAAPLGLAVGAVCIGSIGFAQSFSQLIALQIIGVIATGAYHPAATSVAGQLGRRTFRQGRGMAVSIFIAAGMLGHTIGPIYATHLNALFGMKALAIGVVPTLIAAWFLHRLMRAVPHRNEDHHAIRESMSPEQRRAHWWVVALLTAQNCIKYCVNVGMFILFPYWARTIIPGNEDSASILNGNLSAAMTLGMGTSVMVVGHFLKNGHEKRVFVLTALIGAFVLASTGFVGDWARLEADGAWWGMLPTYFMAFVMAASFFSCIPASIGLGQRLQPSHTALVTSLLMGFGWMFGALSRPFASMLLGHVRLEDAGEQLDPHRVHIAFAVFGSLLFVSAVLALLMSSKTLREAADHH